MKSGKACAVSLGRWKVAVCLVTLAFVTGVISQDETMPYDEVTDPISGRVGHVLKPGSRRRLNAVGCGTVVTCPTKTATDAANALLGSNGNLTISNAVFSKGACPQWGIIPSNGWAPGHVMASRFPKGALVLSSGSAQQGDCNTNTLDYFTLLVGGGGDANLNALIPSYTTYDAIALEFDVTAQKDGQLVFQYSFGSDEYTEWVGTAFNDVFGFFIAPASVAITSGHNVAIVKGTTNTQVSINNVNQYSHTDIWTNNRAFEVAVTAPIEADGYTSLLNTQGYQVTAGSTYHFKLAIADAGDQILDSWVYLGAGSLLIDAPPNANGTVDPPKDCTNKIAYLNASSTSDDDDASDQLTYTWTLTAPCYPTQTYTGKIVQVNLVTLADGVTYDVLLVVSDDSDVSDKEDFTLTVPPGCGTPMAPNCGGTPQPTSLPGVSKPPSPPPPSPPPPDWGDIGTVVQVTGGGAAVVPCGGNLAITAGTADDAGLAALYDNYESTTGYPKYYIWRMFDILDTGYDTPLVEKTVLNADTVLFTAADLKQGTFVKKYKAVLDVTDVAKWDKGNGEISPVTTFVQLLACPIKTTNPLTQVPFGGPKPPDPFTLACSAKCLLNATLAYNDAAAKYGKPVTTRVFKWTVQDLTGAVKGVVQQSVPTYVLIGTKAVLAGYVNADEVYGLTLKIYLNGEDFDSDNWATKWSVEACPSPPPKPPKPFKSPPPPV